MDNYQKNIEKAVKSFWKAKQRQLQQSADKSNRGAVVAGHQMDGFVDLLKTVAVDAGVKESCIFTKNNYLPGYFRSSKDWDMVIISPSNKLIAAIELKSQVGSYGNNFNNRAEEAIGSAVDIWTAFRENQFPEQRVPWIGYFMLVGKDVHSTRPVKNNESHYPVLPEFDGASYIDRYGILCQKLVRERHYSSVALLWTNDKADYGDVSSEISLTAFLSSFYGFLKGCAHGFE